MTSGIEQGPAPVSIALSLTDRTIIPEVVSRIRDAVKGLDDSIRISLRGTSKDVMDFLQQVDRPQAEVSVAISLRGEAKQ